MKPIKIPGLHAHCLNSWQWFYSYAWKKKNEAEIVEQAERLLHKLTHLVKIDGQWYGVSLHDGFAWLSSGHSSHKIWNKKTPWIWDKKKKMFLLDEWESRWWELAELWLRLHKKAGLDYAFHLFMGFGYNLLPFRKNNKSIHASCIWDERLWPYQGGYIEKLMKLYKSVNGPKYKPFVKIGNEFAHFGNAWTYHEIMYFHQEAWECILGDYTKLNRVIVDVSHCEGALEELREYHACGKPEGCDRFGEHGYDPYNRKAIQEDHGYSTIEDYTRLIDWQGEMVPAIDIYLSSGNRYKRFTEDGGSRTGKGLGNTWPPQGSGLPVEFNFANKEQSRYMARTVWTKAKNANKRIIIGWYPVEGLVWYRDSKGVERHEADYNPSRIDWSRPKVMAREWVRIYGG